MIYEGKLIDLSAFQSFFNFRNIIKMHLALTFGLFSGKHKNGIMSAFCFHDEPVEMHTESKLKE